MFKTNHQRFLKVKIKSLAAESKIIRAEEKKSRKTLREELYHHRTRDVRRESRAAQLAYAYLRGKSLKDTEGREGHDDIDGRVGQIVKKFGTKAASDSFGSWFN